MTDFELKLLKLLTILIKQGEATPEDACYVFKIEREVNKELGNESRRDCKNDDRRGIIQFTV